MSSTPDGSKDVDAAIEQFERAANRRRRAVAIAALVFGLVACAASAVLFTLRPTEAGDASTSDSALDRAGQRAEERSSAKVALLPLAAGLFAIGYGVLALWLRASPTELPGDD